MVDYDISSHSKHFTFPSEADPERSRTGYRSASEECVYSSLIWTDCQKTYKSRKSRDIVGTPPLQMGG